MKSNNITSCSIGKPTRWRSSFSTVQGVSISKPLENFMNDQEIRKYLSKEKIFENECEPWETYEPQDLEAYVKKALNHFFGESISIKNIQAVSLNDDSKIKLIILSDKYSFEIINSLSGIYQELWDVLNQIQECHKIRSNSFFYGYVDMDTFPTIAYITRDEYTFLQENDGFSYIGPYEVIETDYSYKLLLEDGDIEPKSKHKRVVDVTITELKNNEIIILDPVEKEEPPTEKEMIEVKKNLKSLFGQEGLEEIIRKLSKK